MATGDPDYLTNETIPLYVPIPFAATYPRGNQATGTAPATGNTGAAPPGPVYAQALFLRATCQSSDRIGAWVRATDVTNDVTTTTSQLSYPAIGLIVSKDTATRCVVQTYGLCAGIYASLTPNLRLFVGPDGQATKGSALPSGTAYVQPIGFSVRADTFFVQPSGVLFRRDAAADQADPAPAPSGNGTSTYRPVLHGVGAPDSSIGQLGDAYLSTDTLALYQRDASGWGSPQPFAAATQGAKGEPGSRIYRVATLPADGTGYSDGDLLIDDQGNLATVQNA